MKHQMIITFEIPDGTPGDEWNEAESEVDDFVQNRYSTWYPQIESRQA